MEIDIHVHSVHSPDSMSRPKAIAARAMFLGLGALAVTDHDTWEGGRATAKVADGKLIVIPGAELKTEKGDLLALFVIDEIRGRTFAEKVDEIHAEGGIAIIPHPGVSKRITRAELSMADGFEAFNATLSRKDNERSVEMAAGLKKPGFGCSDAHMVMEIGNGRTRVQDCQSPSELREVILKEPVVSRSVTSNPLLHRMNEAVLFATKGVWRR